jgi:hypothetical protein
MKPRNRQSRSLNVSSSRWMAYAVAGLATASGSAISAEGAIHYSGLINFKFQKELGFQTHSFPLSQGAVLVGFREADGGGDSSATFEIKGAAVSNAFREYSSSLRVANALPRGSVISQGYFVAFRSGVTVGRLQDYSCSFPGWVEPGTYYIGFRFDGGAGKQYGWVRIKWAGCNGDKKYIVKDYAWGDPGDKIKTGQKQLHEDDSQAAKSDEAAPLADSQGSLGLLALGAVGLQAWRKSRRSVNSAAP